MRYVSLCLDVLCLWTHYIAAIACPLFFNIDIISKRIFYSKEKRYQMYNAGILTTPKELLTRILKSIWNQRQRSDATQCSHPLMQKDLCKICLMIWFGHSTLSNVILFLSCQVVHWIHNGIAFQIFDQIWQGNPHCQHCNNWSSLLHKPIYLNNVNTQLSRYLMPLNNVGVDDRLTLC